MARKRANADLTNVEELGLQLTPMIDVIFQLLIFFLVNIRFRTMEGLLKAFLPKVDTTQQEPDPNEDKAFVQLRKLEGSYPIIAVNGQPVGGLTREAKLAALEEKLNDFKESFEKMPPVIIDAEKRLEYKYVIDVLNVCGKLDLEDVMFQFPQQ